MNMTIEELEAYLLDHYSNGGVDQSLFMKLAEEIGEVAEVLKKRIGPAANSKECFAFSAPQFLLVFTTLYVSSQSDFQQTFCLCGYVFNNFLTAFFFFY